MFRRPLSPPIPAPATPQSRYRRSAPDNEHPAVVPFQGECPTSKHAVPIRSLRPHKTGARSPDARRATAPHNGPSRAVRKAPRNAGLCGSRRSSVLGHGGPPSALNSPVYSSGSGSHGAERRGSITTCPPPVTPTLNASASGRRRRRCARTRTSRCPAGRCTRHRRRACRRLGVVHGCRRSRCSRRDRAHGPRRPRPW